MKKEKSVWVIWDDNNGVIGIAQSKKAAERWLIRLLDGEEDKEQRYSLEWRLLIS